MPPTSQATAGGRGREPPDGHQLRTTITPADYPVTAPLHRWLRARGGATIAHMDSRGSILVVDDEPTITEVVSRYLERAGYATRVAATARTRCASPARSAPTSWCST